MVPLSFNVVICDDILAFEAAPKENVDYYLFNIKERYFRLRAANAYMKLNIADGVSWVLGNEQKMHASCSLSTGGTMLMQNTFANLVWMYACVQ